MHALQRHSPDKLLTHFARTPIVRWLLVAIAAHAVVIAVTSLGYVRDRWIDPEGAKARQEAARAARAAAAPTPAPAPAAPAAALPEVAGSAADQAILEQRQDTPVVQRITEAAKPADIPKEPDGLGISLDETNPR